MVAEPVNILSGGLANIAAVLPAVIGALIILLVGWIAGRLLGRAVRIVCDRAASSPVIGGSELGKTVTLPGFSAGYIADIFVRIVVYLIAILAAVDILNMDYLSQFMVQVIGYIPHAAAFVIILVAGIILTDFFIDTFQTYAKNASMELVGPVMVLLRLFMYFVVVMLALSQLMLDLTIIYTIITPIAWGLGIGLGASIAIIVWFGMKNRSEQIMDRVMEVIAK